MKLVHTNPKKPARKTIKQRQAENNADIRPWISAGEAAQLALSMIAANMERAKGEK